jgi:hypothetical protein
VTTDGALSPLLHDLDTPPGSPSIIALASRIYDHSTPSICTSKPSFPQALTSLSRCLELLKGLHSGEVHMPSNRYCEKLLRDVFKRPAHTMIGNEVHDAEVSP